ncbi:hypothetical protein VUR80DRAFT_4649 [Thermomyces stellatus]
MGAGEGDADLVRSDIREFDLLFVLQRNFTSLCFVTWEGLKRFSGWVFESVARGAFVGPWALRSSALFAGVTRGFCVFGMLGRRSTEGTVYDAW